MKLQITKVSHRAFPSIGSKRSGDGRGAAPSPRASNSIRWEAFLPHVIPSHDDPESRLVLARLLSQSENFPQGSHTPTLTDPQYDLRVQAALTWDSIHTLFLWSAYKYPDEMLSPCA